MKLRPYQKQASEAHSIHFRKYQLNPAMGNPLIVIPTGGGKTHIIADFCATHTDINILVVSHVKEILTQNIATIHKITNESIGIWSAGLCSRETRRITVAGIQSLSTLHPDRYKPDIIIVDEAHLIPPNGEGRYRSFLKKYPDTMISGFTATPFRRLHGYLTENHIFKEIIYNADILDLIDQGYLCNLLSKSTGPKMDTTGFKIVAGDYSKKDLQTLSTVELSELIIEDLVKYKNSRKKWLVFAIDIAHCESVAKLLVENGIPAAAVHSRMDRELPLKLFKEGHLQAVVSVETLTTGFDAPDVDLIALMRPTASPVLHVQMIGRGSRIAPGKENCLVLDYSDNIGRLGPINAVRIPKKGEKRGQTIRPTKSCPACQEIVLVQTRICPVCGFEFRIKAKLLPISSEKSVLVPKIKVVDNPFKWIPVDDLSIKLSARLGKPKTLKITYFPACVYNKDITIWYCFDHDGYPKHIAREWWKQYVNTRIPKSTNEAFERRNEIKKPKRIFIEDDKKFIRILKYEYK